MSDLVVLASWGSRDASVEECATTVLDLLSSLSEATDVLSDWWVGKRTPDAHLPSRRDVIKGLLAGQSRRDDNGEVMEGSGYLISLKSGIPYGAMSSISLNMVLGGTGSGHNYADLTFGDGRWGLPAAFDEDGPPFDVETAVTILSSMIGLLNPDFTVWYTDDLLDFQCEPDTPLPNGGVSSGRLVGDPAGWATYLARGGSTAFDIALLPPSASVRELDSGTLVLLGDDPVHPSVQEVMQVRVAMGFPVFT